jgi:hypothetical protein
VRIATLGSLISYSFGIFSIAYKSDWIAYRIANAIQYSIVTLLNVLVLLNINLFCSCKKEKREEATIKANQENIAELDVIKEGKRLTDSISQERAAISKLKELADKGDNNAGVYLSFVVENIKAINIILNLNIK